MTHLANILCMVIVRDLFKYHAYARSARVTIEVSPTQQQLDLFLISSVAVAVAFAVAICFLPFAICFFVVAVIALSFSYNSEF